MCNKNNTVGVKTVAAYKMSEEVKSLAELYAIHSISLEQLEEKAGSPLPAEVQHYVEHVREGLQEWQVRNLIASIPNISVLEVQCGVPEIEPLRIKVPHDTIRDAICARISHCIEGLNRAKEEGTIYEVAENFVMYIGGAYNKTSMSAMLLLLQKLNKPYVTVEDLRELSQLELEQLLKAMAPSRDVWEDFCTAILLHIEARIKYDSNII